MNFLFIAKVTASAAIIALASELSKKSSLAATMTLALPVTSLLALVWVHFESGDRQKLIELSWGVFWLVPPSLVFFPVFATLIAKDFSFWLSFLFSSGVTILFYLGYSRILAEFGVHM